MSKKKGKSYLSTFLIILISVSIYIVVYNLRPDVSKEDIYEIYTMPEEVERILNNPLENPLRATPPPIHAPKHIKIPILLYHYVEYVKDKGDTIRISLNTPPHILEKQIKTLLENKYTFITPSQIPKYFSGNVIIPKECVILSFDDGYKDFYTDVFPILKKYNVKAVVFVVTEFLDKHNNLSTEELRQLSESNLVEIGAHTIDHMNLTMLNEERIKYEVIQSKNILEKKIGNKIVSFAYPYGAFNLEVAKIVKDAGYKTAVSTVLGDDVNLGNLFFLYRLRPGYRTGDGLVSVL